MHGQYMSRRIRSALYGLGDDGEGVDNTQANLIKTLSTYVPTPPSTFVPSPPMAKWKKMLLVSSGVIGGLIVISILLTSLRDTPSKPVSGLSRRRRRRRSRR